ncbi:MAG: benzoyl-CoA-dihydrodiol lyase [Sneathiella sp.]|uniref:2,3-epoxybenzoyl-CoA dihydrolase n=1 Tax=Sneathiella sp. TaxID=1964365 RepID=UPI000C578B6B|nr:2,3-epoxybenzoyl-CoA dihydrolase [Sneathiella sp.]MAZ02588.1 benzoyl-CoA-dihydrodiol lyase [Sneathiella sp.]
MITFDRHPDNYRHWNLSVDGAVAMLTLSVDEDAGIVPGYQLKLNSYDLGVDIELNDALQRIRFEHPTVRSVIITSGIDKMFCAGANIYMLGTSSHGWKVNFCKFTNETRNGMEDSSRHSDIKFIAACNGTTAGGGYELALACDEIFLIDDRSSTVSLPEVPLLGVLPGTGGLTRLTDKRKVRHDLADVFCTNPDGVRGWRAKEWGLVDEVVPRNSFDEKVLARAEELAAKSMRPTNASGVSLSPLDRNIDTVGYHYRYVDVTINETEDYATLTVAAPGDDMEVSLQDIHKAGADWWPLAMARELDDAILMLRTNNEEIGTLLLKTSGAIDNVLKVDAALAEHEDDWFVREVIGMLRRTLSRLDVSSRSLFALIEEGSCFAGTLYELALAADRIYMLDIAEEEGSPPHIALSMQNFGAYEAANGKSRLAQRFYDDDAVLDTLKEQTGIKLDAAEAEEKGLVTFIPDDIDWEEEIRLLIEERSSLSPDALTGLEANLRFGGSETPSTKIFGRLSAWQNWIFNRPNAVGEKGALKLFGSGTKAEFDKRRV